jgi:hypothetical protein
MWIVVLGHESRLARMTRSRLRRQTQADGGVVHFAAHEPG